jgi:hypothetical protein
MNKMIQHTNKWMHGETNLVMPQLPTGFMLQTGIYYLTLILDKAVGEEVVLIIYDPTDFIYDLKEVVPFRFHIASIAVNTSFGSVYSFIFWVSQPNDDNKSFAIFDKPINISNPQSIYPWIQLSKQTHVHLLLVGANHEVEGFYEFENDFGFDEAVESMSMLSSKKVIDFVKAEQEYFDSYSLQQLYDMVKRT